MIEMNIDAPPASGARIVGDWLEVNGWAFDSQAAVTEILVTTSDGEQTRGTWGFPRPDVAAAFGAPHAHFSGFWAMLAPRSRAEALEISVRVTAADGSTRLQSRRVETFKVIEQRLQPVSACTWCGSARVAPVPRVQKGPYTLNQCGDCGVGFVSPLPNIDSLKGYYDEVYWDQSPAVLKKHDEHPDSGLVDKWLREHAANARQIMEVGCGPGLLLNGLRRRGYEVEGQDYSTRAAELALERFGINVRVAPLGELPVERFDGVVLRHVLEHSPTARADLQAVVRALRPGGVIILVTPSMDSFAREALESAWEWFVPPVHLFFCSVPGLRYFADQHGLELVQTGSRRGDAASTLGALRARLAYDGATMTRSERDRLASSVAALERAGDDAAEQVMAVLDRASELNCVLRKPFPQ